MFEDCLCDSNSPWAGSSGCINESAYYQGLAEYLVGMACANRWVAGRIVGREEYQWRYDSHEELARKLWKRWEDETRPCPGLQALPEEDRTRLKELVEEIEKALAASPAGGTSGPTTAPSLNTDPGQ